MEISEPINTKKLESTKTTIAGFVMLVIAMGIGRFSYTSILPLMQSQAQLSAAQSGYLAGYNNLGYLIAAFSAGFITWGNRRSVHLRIQLVLCILTTGFMGITTSYVWWVIFRFLAGISSGFIFVLSSSFVLDALLSSHRVKWLGIFYGGVGAGITLTGFLTPILSHFTWRGTWIGLSIISIALLVPVLSFIKEDQQKPSAKADDSLRSSAANSSFFGWLLVTYGLEGLGYIVSATFLVAMVKQMPGMSGMADFSWMIVGIAAIPSTVVWSWWANKAGYIQPLITALILQACGVILPVCLPNIIGVTLGSVLFGGTFMGISMLAIAAARMVSRSGGSKSIALMTGFFGIGQILGPIGAGTVLEVAHSYSMSLILATLVLVVAVTILITGAVISNQKGFAFMKTH